MIQDTLDKELSNVVHIAINLLYQCPGNPSGRVLTTIKNSLICLILLCYACVWKEEERDAKFAHYLSKLRQMDELPLTEQVAAGIALIGELIDEVIKTSVIYGDDHLFKILAQHPYTMKDVAKVASLFGMKYTSVYKNAELPEFYILEEAKFLQRFFRVRNNICYAPLDKEIIEHIPYHISSKGSAKDMTLAVCDSALREAYQWGREYFNDLKVKYDRVLKQFEYPATRVLYEDSHAQFFAFKCQMKTVEFKAQMSAAHSDKQEVLQTEETTVQTTTFADNVGKTDTKSETPMTITPVAKGTDPYPDQGMGPVLSRPYEVGTFSWSSSSVAGDNLYSISFPAALMAKPNIDDKLNRFQYLRAGIRVSIRINGTQFHQGQLLISTVRHWNTSDSIQMPFFNIYTAACCEPRILSASTNTTLDFDIPYVGPSNYWNMLYDPTAAAAGFMGQICFFVLAPLALLGATTTQTLDLTIYASFINPEVAGLGLRTGATDRVKWAEEKLRKLQLKDKKNPGPVFKAQMSQTKEQRKRSDKNTQSEIAPASSGGFFDTIVSTFTSIGSKVLSEFATNAIMGMFLNKPTSTQLALKVQRKEFSTFAHANGLDGCERLSMHPESKISTDISRYADPTDYNKFVNYKLKPGLVYMGSFDGTTAAGSKPYVTVVSPTICPNATVTGGVCYYPTPLAHMSSFCALWRGGMKFCFKFSCSRFVTARIRFVHLPDPTFSASFPVGQEGDVINKVVDITGDTSVTLTIPYLRETYWQKVVDPASNTPPITGWTGFNGQLVLYIVNPVTNAQVAYDSTINFSVWVSGAEDFQLARPISLWNDYIDGTGMTNSFKAQMQSNATISSDMTALFREPFETIVPATTGIPQGIQNGETVDSFPELMHRYSLLRIDTQEGTNPWRIVVNPWQLNNDDGTVPGTTFGIRNTYQRIRKSFLFAMGGFRLKNVLSYWDRYVVEKLTSTSDLWWRVSNYTDNEINDSISIADAGLAFNTGMNALSNEVEIPPYMPWNMHCNSFGIETTELPQAQCMLYSWRDDAASTFGVHTYISAADDFTLGCPINPTPLFLPVGSITKQESDNNNNSSFDLKKKDKYTGGNRPQTGNFNITQTMKGIVPPPQ